MTPRRLYLDNAATSFPKPASVMAAMQNYAANLGASAGRGAYHEAIETGDLIHECRRRLNRLFNGEKPEHFIFTPNCTEALNLAMKGSIRPSCDEAAICTAIDHNSILRPLMGMVDRDDLDLTRIRVDPSTGLVSPLDVLWHIREHKPKLLAITHVSNVTGTIQPIREIGKIAREHGVLFVVDAAQSAGHIPIDVQADYIDFLAAPGHKGLLGPLGTGFLYIRPGLEGALRPLVEGGTGSISEEPRQPEFMPDKFESGSHNAIGLVGLSASVQWILDQTVEKLAIHDRELVGTFIDGVADLASLKYFGPQGVKNRVGVFSVRIDGFAPHELSAALESSFGILTRSGIHCAPFAHESIGTSEGGGTTRLSFGPFLTKQDIGFVADALAELATSSIAGRSASSV